MKQSLNTISSNLVQSTIRLKNGHKAVGPLRPARPEDSNYVQELSKKIAASELPSDSIQLTSGLGIHRSYEFPVRAPALLIPSLHVMEEMQRIGLKTPRYLVYQATDFIAETNELDKGRAQESSEKLQTYLRRYVETYHAKVAECVDFEFGIEYTDSVRNLIRNLTEEVREKMSHLLPISNAAEKIRAYEKRNSNASDSYAVYAAANSLYSGATPDYPFEDKMDKNVSTIIPVGGGAEKPFFEVTSTIAEAHSLTRKIVPFLTSLGSRSTYYPYKESGDPMTIAEFAESIANPHKDGPIRGDINAMIADGATPETLRTIYPEQ